MRNLQHLADGLRRYLPNGDRVTGVRPLSGGHSNETYVVQGIDCVLRLPPSSVVLIEQALDIRGQYDLYQNLSGMVGVPPVPRVDQFCDDANVLGSPFFLMQLLPGEAGFDWGAGEWLEGGGPELRDQVSRQQMEALIHLHTADTI